VPLKFGGKKVLPPGSRERVKKAGAALTHPQPVFGVIGSKLEYRQQQQHRVNRSETLAEGGIAVRQRAYTGPQGIQPFALAMPPRKSNISSEPMPEVSPAPSQGEPSPQYLVQELIISTATLTSPAAPVWSTRPTRNSWWTLRPHTLKTTQVKASGSLPSDLS
jgi:hypothetical protein